MITKLIALLVILLIIPYCIGLIPISLTEDRHGIIATYIFGFVISLALFELVSVPVIINRPSGFPLIVGIYLGVECACAMAGVVLYNFRTGRAIRSDEASHKGEVRERKGHERGQREHKGIRLTYEAVLWSLVVISILFQIVMYVCMASFDGDDAYYVVQSLLTNETDTLYRIKPYTGLSTGMDLRHALASMPVWIAFLARVSGIHSTIIAHTVIGILFIPIIYGIYYNCGLLLFNRESRKTAAFMLFVSIMYIFGNVSIYTGATFLLTRTWQGKAMLANLIIGVCTWLFIAIYKRNDEDEDEEKLTLGYYIVLFALSIASVMCSTAGVFLIAMLIGIYGVTMSIYRRDIQIALRLMITCVPLVAYGAVYLLL